MLPLLKLGLNYAECFITGWTSPTTGITVRTCLIYLELYP